MPISPIRPTKRHLERMLKELETKDVGYLEVGATRSPALPSGYGHDERSIELGSGEGSWTRAVDALRCWQAQRAVGASVTPDDAPVETGTTLITALRVGPVVVVAPCRVVYVTDESNRFGFAYGTLPGHPEEGEEAFHVTRSGDGRITMEIRVFSRPANLLARLGSPVATAMQRRVTKGYLEGVRRYVTHAGASPEAPEPN